MDDSLSVGFLLYLIVVAVLGARVIMRRPPPGVGAAWLLSLILLPYVGAVLYLLIGERAIGRRRLNQAAEMLPSVSAHFAAIANRAAARVDEVPERWRPIGRLAARAASTAPLRANEVALIDGAEPILKSVIADIAGATQTCFMEFYIWQEGGLADEIGLALLHAAGRGVCCRLLLDDVGSAPFFDSAWPERFRAAGIDVQRALPVGLLRAMFRRIDLRLHRKLIVIDRQLAYTGSLNLVDPRYFKRNAGLGYWVDAMVRVQGPVVDALSALFAWDWALESGERFLVAEREGRMDDPPIQAGEVVQMVPSGPGYEESTIVQLLLSAVYGARTEITLTTPYFVPGEALVGALRAAALRGVGVRLIVPERVDSLLVRQASRAFYDDLLQAGVEILQFHGGLLHTKSVVVDRELVFFGTVNLDLRSLLLNHEITLIVYGTSFASAVADLQRKYADQAEPIDAANWRQRSATRRFVENTVRLASPLL
ncbi:MAG: cardiolipin synthase [Methylotetracoccus sp.]